MKLANLLKRGAVLAILASLAACAVYAEPAPGHYAYYDGPGYYHNHYWR